MKRLALLLVLAAPPALAQEVAPPMEQALRTELGNKIGESIALRATLIETQRALAVEQAKVKALTEKYEPKKD